MEAAGDRVWRLAGQPNPDVLSAVGRVGFGGLRAEAVTRRGVPDCSGRRLRHRGDDCGRCAELSVAMVFIGLSDLRFGGKSKRVSNVSKSASFSAFS